MGGATLYACKSHTRVSSVHQCGGLPSCDERDLVFQLHNQSLQCD
jgi:hypothetical protein